MSQSIHTSFSGTKIPSPPIKTIVKHRVLLGERVRERGKTGTSNAPILTLSLALSRAQQHGSTRALGAGEGIFVPEKEVCMDWLTGCYFLTARFSNGLRSVFLAVTEDLLLFEKLFFA